VYGNFEISFQGIQSIRTIHAVRFETFKKLNTLLKNRDVVITGEDNVFYHEQIRNVSIKNSTVRISKTFNVALIDSALQEKRSVYIVVARKRWFSEGGDSVWHPLDRDKYSYTPVYEQKSLPVIELALYRFMRMWGMAHKIPKEEWVIYSLAAALDTDSATGDIFKKNDHK
jgi:hypothetical protein